MSVAHTFTSTHTLSLTPYTDIDTDTQTDTQVHMRTRTHAYTDTLCIQRPVGVSVAHPSAPMPDHHSLLIFPPLRNCW